MTGFLFLDLFLQSRDFFRFERVVIRNHWSEFLEPLQFFLPLRKLLNQFVVIRIRILVYDFVNLSKQVKS
jgi:hypothetical protein